MVAGHFLELKPENADRAAYLYCYKYLIMVYSVKQVEKNRTVSALRNEELKSRWNRVNNYTLEAIVLFQGFILL